MKEKGKKYLLVAIVIFLLMLIGNASGDAQDDNSYKGNISLYQCKLDLRKHPTNGLLVADGVHKAKMNVVIRDKETNNIINARSDVEILLSSENSTVEPQTITISQGKLQSEGISLTSTQSGNACVKAEAVDFDSATTCVEFVPPLKPYELLLEANPRENLLANGKGHVTLTVRLLGPDGQPFLPQQDTIINIWTNKGESLDLEISEGTAYGQKNFGTYKCGVHNLTAHSPVFRIEDRTTVTFVSVITALTIFFALVGGFLGGVVKYYQEQQKGLIFLPKKQEDGTWRLGMLGHSFFHAFFGLIVYMGACLNMPLANLFDLPIDVGSGAFMIGLTGGLFFFVIISVWGMYVRRMA